MKKLTTEEFIEKARKKTLDNIQPTDELKMYFPNR
jgi:hypothetical protein